MFSCPFSSREPAPWKWMELNVQCSSESRPPPPARPSTGTSECIFREPHSSRPSFLSRPGLGKCLEVRVEAAAGPSEADFSPTLGPGPQEAGSGQEAQELRWPERQKVWQRPETEKCSKAWGWGTQLLRPPRRARASESTAQRPPWVRAPGPGRSASASESWGRGSR